MKVSDIMSTSVEKISFNSVLTEAAQKMKSCDIGVLPVEKNDEVVGMITDRDIVIRAIAEKMDPKTTTVDKAMTFEVFSCREDDDLRDAVLLMEEKQVHRLVVLNDNDELSGILSISDIALKAKDEHLAYEVLEKISEPSQASW